jgi:hypothetical protein
MSIKFPKSANNSFLKTGKIQTQPVAKISISGMSKDNASALSKLLQPGGDSNAGRPGVASPLLQPVGDSNAGRPGGPSVTGFGNKTQEKDIITNSNDSTPQKPLSEFEKLTNISDSRPEIIALTDFHPLYIRKDAEQTEHGNLFDVYVQTMRQIENDAIAINSLKNNEITKKRNEALKQSVSSLTDATKSVYQILKRIELDRKRLNLFNEVYDFSAIEFVNKEIPEDSKTDKDLLKDYCKKFFIAEKASLLKTLSKLTKIKTDDLAKFSSTKLWLMLVKEIQHLLNSYISEKSYDNSNDNSIPNRPDDKNLSIFLEFEKNAGTNLAISSAIDELDFASAAKEEIENDSTNKIAAGYNTRRDQLDSEANRFVDIFNALNTSLEKVNSDKHKSIAIIFNSICKEIRISSCYDPSSAKLVNALNFFNTSLPGLRTAANDKSANYDFLEKVIGSVKSNDRIYSPVSANYQNSLKGLSFLLTNDKSVLTLEESENQTIKSEKGTFPNIADAGSYIYSEERLVEFVDSNGNYDLSSRANLLGKKLSSLDFHFSTIAYDLGMLSTKDTQVFNKDFSPNYVSTDPNIFFNKIFDVLNSNLNKAEFDYNNPNLGVISFLKHIGKTSPNYVKLKSYVYLMVNFYNSNRSRDDIFARTYVLNTLIYSFLYDKSFSDLPQEILDDLDAIRATIEKQTPYANESKTEKGKKATFEMAIDYIDNKLQNGEFSWLPCRYEDEQKFGEALINHPVFKLIADVLKEVEKVLFTYASGNSTGLTSFNGVSFEAIKLMMFEALIRCIHLMEGSEVKGWAMEAFDSTISRLPLTKGGKFNIQNIDNPESSVQKGLFWNSYVKLSPGVTNNGFNNSVYALMSAGPIRSKIKEEISHLNTSIITALNTIKTLKKGIDDSLSTINSLTGEELSYLAQYVGGKEKLKFLLSKNQLNLLMSNLEDMNFSVIKFSSSVNTSNVDFNNYLETLSHSGKMVKVLKKFFNDQEFTKVKGYNKKIITIGLAQNLIKNMLTKIQLEKLTNKHDDIIKVSIYKMDLLNNDIVYLPKTFLFEASRYPVRVVDAIPDDIANIKQLRTRNYSFYNKSNAKDDGEVSTMAPPLDDEEYSFLNISEKSQIIENHIISFLLENYLKITTGLVLNETTFNLDNAEAEALLSLQKSTIGPDDSFSNATYFSDSVFPANVEFIKKLVAPKKFDRVFNIIFDPEFQVDVSATQNTFTGKKLLETMISLGKIKKVGSEYYDNDKRESDVTLYSYFAVLETHAKSIKMSIDKQAEGGIKQPKIKDLVTVKEPFEFDAFNGINSGQNFGVKF